jgi:predicted adenine nucleotide alpha hydrolase (AANH) superfamily ATPase
MKLLLHTCCAPCLLYPLERLKEKGFEVTGFFYNPNIHPFTEYQKRKDALELVNKKTGIDIIFFDYAPAEYFNAINLKENAPERCALCWRLRLKKTAEFAREKGLDYFSTTLLVSPYQDQEVLRGIGEEISKEERVIFYYDDFRAGFRKSHEAAKAEGIYCQKYCGCIYSEMERYKKKPGK